MGTGSFPGVKGGRGVTLTPHPLLVPWSWKSKAIPLLPLWAVKPVQSLSACTRVHFTFTFYTFWNAQCNNIHSSVKTLIYHHPDIILVISLFFHSGVCIYIYSSVRGYDTVQSGRWVGPSTFQRQVTPLSLEYPEDSAGTQVPTWQTTQCFWRWSQYICSHVASYLMNHALLGRR